MKKRILTVFVALFCLFSLASCKKDTPYSLYNDAMKKMETVGGIDAKVKTDATVKMGSTENNNKSEMTMKTNKDAAYIEMDGAKYIYIDGTLYMDMGSEGKVKATVSKDEFEDQFGGSDFPEITEEDLKDVELKKDGDNQTFTVTLKGDKIQQFVKDIMSSALEGAGNNITVGDVVLTCVFDKSSNLTQMTMVMDVTYTEKTVGEIKISTTMVYDFNNIDSAPAITAPSDASSYMDIGSLS